MKKKILMVTIAGLLAVPPLVRGIGFRLNFTDSAPHGLWIERPTGHIERGMLVSACPPDLPIVHERLPYGDCPVVNARPLFKAIGAIPGDTVTIEEGMPVKVNGVELPNTTAAQDVSKWPDGTYTVTHDEVWLFSTYSERSLDSRYFGPVKTSNIIGKAVPVLINGNSEDMTRGMTND